MVVHFDSRGRPGRDAKDGRDGRDGRDGWSGRDGADGENGHPATPAIAAEDSQINIVALEAVEGAGPPLLRVHGRSGQTEIDKAVPVDLGAVRLDSRGMPGGHGGRGGDGGRGGRGGRGRDATAHFSGGNGGDGGDGGHAGAGSNGADGGSAALSQVLLSSSEAYLLMLIEEESPGVLDGRIPGGAGGERGAHGRPGSGGRGGSGGSSYSRTIRNSEGEVVRRIYNSGGFSGSSGTSGRVPNIRLVDGQDGADSEFHIAWLDPDGRKRTFRAGRYDLEITKIEIRANPERAVDTGLFERDQYLDAWVTVRNTNPQMPTPDPALGNLKIIVALKTHREDERAAGIDVDDDGEVVDEAWIEIDQTIEPGREFRLPLPFTFQGKTGLERPVRGDLPHEVVTVSPRASLCRRPFRRALRPTPVELQHVAEITPIEGRRVLAWGDKTLVRFQVLNHCTLELGARAEPARVLATDIVFEGSDYALGTEDFIYYNEAGEETDITEHLRYEIERLKPGEARTITGSVQLRATERTRVPYQSLRLQAAIHIGLVNQPLVPFTNQLRIIEIQSVEPFPKPEQYLPHIVFVTNSSTKRQEILNRRRVANDLKLLHADFNISYHGELDFDTNPLLSPLTDTTFEIINTSEVGLDGRVRKERSADILKTDQTLRAYREKGIRILFTGPESEGTDLEKRIFPQRSNVPASHNTYTSLDEFYKAWRQGRSDARANAFGADHITNLEIVTWWNREVSEADFVAQIEHMRRRLRKDDLHNRYILTYSFEPEVLDPERPWHQKIRNKRRVGSVSISRTTPANENPLNHIAVSDERLRDPDFVFSFDYLFGLMKSLPFSVKLGVLDTLDDAFLGQNLYIDNPNAGQQAYYLKAVFFAILSDLAEEQELLRRDKWRAGLSRKELQEAMPNLAALGRYDFRELSPDTRKLEVFAKLAAEIDYMIHGQKEIVQGYVPGYNLLRRSHTLRKAGHQLFKRFLTNPELVGEKEEPVYKAFREAFALRRSDRKKGLVELREHGALAHDIGAGQRAELRRLRKEVVRRDGRARSYGRLLPRELAEAYRSDRDVLDPNDPDAIRSAEEAGKVLDEQAAFDGEVSDFYEELRTRLKIYAMEEPPHAADTVDAELLDRALAAAAEVSEDTGAADSFGRERE